jgi:hypothetical protein
VSGDQELNKETGAAARVTLVINRFDSQCGACGGAADPYEDIHKRPMGYMRRPGCGARYTHVTSGYPDLMEGAARMRPDLIPASASRVPADSLEAS